MSGLRVGLLAACIGVGMVATACGGGQSPQPQSPAATSPAAVPTTVAPEPTADPDHEAVLAAYSRYIEVSNAAANRGEADYPELAEVATGPALAQARNAIRGHQENGRRYEGSRVLVSAAVTNLDKAAPQGQPQAQVEACIDITNYVLTYVDNGEAVEVDRGLAQYLVAVSLYLVEEQWIVVAIESHRETPCD